MTANAEARALLDQLMGVDRDAPLPAGAALPTRTKRPLGPGGQMILPSSKKSKSVYDRDIDPLYCAWGIDIYDLFVNTKSDIGPNPYKVDDGARQEYLSLPPEEKERLGFEARLFSKLQELVQHCDRTVARNNDKLQRELQRQSQKRGSQTQDYVVDVNDGAVEELVRTEVQVQMMKEDIEETLMKLAEVRAQEQEAVKELKKNSKKTEDSEENSEKKEGSVTIKEETEVTTKSDDTHKQGSDAATESAVKEDKIADETKEVPSVALEKLGSLTLEKQRILCQIANIVSQLGPMEDSIEVQLRNLNHVKSDITSDKTVCEVSGNFMSARDADERIAAHYAGKQYVGWKLVRDKLKDMIKQYGKYGPPRPGGGAGEAPLMSYQQSQRRDGGGGYRGNDRRVSQDGRWERGGGGYGGGGGGGYGRRNDRGGGYGGGGYRRR